MSSAGQQEAYGPEAQTADIHERADALNVELLDIWTFQDHFLAKTSQKSQTNPYTDDLLRLRLVPERVFMRLYGLFIYQI